MLLGLSSISLCVSYPSIFAEKLEWGQFTQCASTLVVSPGQESTYKVNALIIPTYPVVVCIMKRAPGVASSQMKGGQGAHCNLSTLLHYGSVPGLYCLLAQTQLQYIYCTLKSLGGFW